MRHTLPLRYVEAVARTGSIRSAAEQLAITPSALTRRILAIEEELGVDLFERHAQGVRLNSAGEIFLRHIRTQMADLERVRSRIADLTGMRRGHVRIAATRQTTRYFLPQQIDRYHRQFPGVTFEVLGVSRDQAEDAVANLEADILIVLEPVRISEFHSLLHVHQPLHCIMHSEHALAQRKSIRLAEAMEHELLLPPRGDGVREILESATRRRGINCHPVVESNDPALLEQIAADGGGISFGIPIGVDQSTFRQSLIAIPLDARDVKPGFLFVGQLRMRTLPVAAAKFVEEIRKVIET